MNVSALPCNKNTVLISVLSCSGNTSSVSISYVCSAVTLMINFRGQRKSQGDEQPPCVHQQVTGI